MPTHSAQSTDAQSSQPSMVKSHTMFGSTVQISPRATGTHALRRNDNLGHIAETLLGYLALHPCPMLLCPPVGRNLRSRIEGYAPTTSSNVSHCHAILSPAPDSMRTLAIHVFGCPFMKALCLLWCWLRTPDISHTTSST